MVRSYFYFFFSARIHRGLANELYPYHTVLSGSSGNRMGCWTNRLQGLVTLMPDLLFARSTSLSASIPLETLCEAPFYILHPSLSLAPNRVFHIATLPVTVVRSARTILNVTSRARIMENSCKTYNSITHSAVGVWHRRFLPGPGAGPIRIGSLSASPLSPAPRTKFDICSVYTCNLSPSNSIYSGRPGEIRRVRVTRARFPQYRARP